MGMSIRCVDYTIDDCFGGVNPCERTAGKVNFFSEAVD